MNMETLSMLKHVAHHAWWLRNELKTHHAHDAWWLELSEHS